MYLAPPPEAGATDPRLAHSSRRSAPRGPAVLLYMSTTGVYGDTGGAVVTEGRRAAAGTDRARRRVAAETTAATGARRGACGA